MSMAKWLVVSLIGTLMVLSSVANAKVVWIDVEQTGKGYCPDVCKATGSEHFRPEFRVPYAVPSGIHVHQKVNKTYYVCAAYMRGWAIGFNIGVKAIDHKCYVTALLRDGPRTVDHSHYYCLCSDTPVEPIKDR